MAGSKKLKRNKADSNEEQEQNGSTSADESEQDDVDHIGQSYTEAHFTINREEYLQAYKDLVNESKYLQIRNNILHRRLAEYYKKRKLDHVLKPFQGTADLESKFQQKLVAYEELKGKAEIETADIWSSVSAVENNIIGRLESAEKKFITLQNLERSTGAGLIYSKKGKVIPDKTVSRFITLQAHKYEQASALSLRYILARNAVAELEAVVRKLETLGPGLYVYQYEQLNIDNMNYKNKIEEREDELIRNRTKCIEHNQILAHIREKMDHTEELIDCAECDLGESEIKYTDLREDLGNIKANRNRLRWLLEVEKHRAGLLTKKNLLRDFQDATDQVMVLRKRKDALEAEIAKTGKKLREARRNL